MQPLVRTTVHHSVESGVLNHHALSLTKKIALPDAHGRMVVAKRRQRPPLHNPSVQISQLWRRAMRRIAGGTMGGVPSLLVASTPKRLVQQQRHVSGMVRRTNVWCASVSITHLRRLAPRIAIGLEVLAIPHSHLNFAPRRVRLGAMNAQMVAFLWMIVTSVRLLLNIGFSKAR